MENKDCGASDSAQKITEMDPNQIHHEVKSESVQTITSNNRNSSSETTGQQQPTDEVFPSTCDLKEQNASTQMEVDDDVNINDSKSCETTKEEPAHTTQERAAVGQCETLKSEKQSKSEGQEVPAIENKTPELAKEAELEPTGTKKSFPVAMDEQAIIPEEAIAAKPVELPSRKESSPVAIDEQVNSPKATIAVNPTEPKETAVGVNNDPIVKMIAEETPQALPEAPQIIENVILVQGTQEQQNITAITETQAHVTSQPKPEASMDIAELRPIEITTDAVQHKVPTTKSQPLETTTTPSSQSGLSLLAQYDSEDDADDSTSSDDDDEDGADSDVVVVKPSANEIERISDSESVIEVPTSNRDYRNRVVEIDSDSDSDSSSADSNAPSELSYLSDIRKAIDKSMEPMDGDADADDDDFDENGVKAKRQAPRVKGEFLLEDLPPIQDLHITVPEAECVELGKVHSIVEQLVLVNALPNSILLDLDTVLFLDKGQRVLGEVFDVLGQVADPLYCVRFNSNKQIMEKNIQVGDQVYVAPKTQYTQFVILSSLMKMRGSDASWENDVEPPPRYLDYSDDEQERDARARLRNRDRSTDHKYPSKRARADDHSPSPSPSPLPSPLNSPAPRYGNYQGRSPRGGGGGGGRGGGGGGRGGGGFRSQPRYQHPRHEYQQHPPTYNAGSWHSNYPQTYAMPGQNFGPMPTPPPHMLYAQSTPPTFAAYPPQVMPYQVSPQQAQQVYVLNPYAVRPPVLGANSGSQAQVYTPSPNGAQPQPPRDG